MQCCAACGRRLLSAVLAQGGQTPAASPWGAATTAAMAQATGAAQETSQAAAYSIHWPQHQHHQQQQTPVAAAPLQQAARAFTSLSSSSMAAAAGGSSGIDGKVGADPDEVADLIEANIHRPGRAEREAAAATAPLRLLTTRREALSLYREVLRYSNLFVWRDEHGRRWRDVLRASARSEFEAARRERDPELINRMIVTGRDAVARTMHGFVKRRASIIEDEVQREAGGAGGPRGPLQ